MKFKVRPLHVSSLFFGCQLFCQIVVADVVWAPRDTAQQLRSGLSFCHNRFFLLTADMRVN
jgi:hypothetical protein